MECEDCKYRFRCFTEKKTPIQVTGVNYQVFGKCSECKYGVFKKDSRHYTPVYLGICKETGYLTHRDGTCPGFTSKKNLRSKRVAETLNKALGKRVKAYHVIVLKERNENRSWFLGIYYRYSIHCTEADRNYRLVVGMGIISVLDFTRNYFCFSIIRSGNHGNGTGNYRRIQT